MAFRSRRFRPGRRRFGGRGIARKEPIWITTAFLVNPVPQLLTQNLFQLVGPEDYTPDFLTEESRKDKCTLVRTVGHFQYQPAIGAQADYVSQSAFKAALFVAGDKEIDDAFSADPSQFDITDPATFVAFCRNYPPLHVFWSAAFRDNNQLFILTNPPQAFRWPPAETGAREWDVTVKRKLEGDGALWMLINSITLQSPLQEVAGFIDIEARNLIMDQ